MRPSRQLRHISIFSEFEITTCPAEDSVLTVRLRHVASGVTATFQTQLHEVKLERSIADGVMLYFPESLAAQELRRRYGLYLCKLRPSWEAAAGERMYAGLSNISGSSGAKFWRDFIPSLPSTLYSAMAARAVIDISEIDPAPSLQALIRVTYNAWHATLKEARTLGTQLAPLQRVAFELSGWRTDALANLTLVEFAQLKEKAALGLLALDYLSNSDWSAMLEPFFDAIGLESQPADV